MSKDGFSYNSGSRVTLARARKARRLVVLAKVLAWGLPIVGVIALIVFTPVIVWGPTLAILAVCGVFAVFALRGYEIARWWENITDDYNTAVREGVRDE